MSACSYSECIIAIEDDLREAFSHTCTWVSSNDNFMKYISVNFQSIAELFQERYVMSEHRSEGNKNNFHSMARNY